ncbi:MAG: hypothetical protein RIQ71_524 [Verrucomicrobiota bacterium]|jgi:hypothetical protein
MKAVIGAVLARCPRSSAGHTCAVTSWVKSLESLGWEVWIAEHLESRELEAPESGCERSPQEEFWHATAAEFGLSGRQCLIIDGASPDLDAFREFAAGADVFINYSGQFKMLDLLGDRITKCYLDVDPGFTQLWVETCGTDMNLAGHDLFFTVGSNFCSPNLRLPRTSQEWVPLLPPCSGDYWRARARTAGGAGAHDSWTTVSHWYGYNDLVWEGQIYGGKRDSLHALRDLPRLSGVPFTIASDLQPGWEDYDAYIGGGWKLASTKDVCRDVDSYLRFIGGSRGEIGVAKGGYIVSRGGWISDRSLVYLALGRPVVLQDTGWPEVVSPRPGLLPFVTTDDAVARIAEVEDDPQLHSAGARALSDTVFGPASALAPVLKRLK